MTLRYPLWPKKSNQLILKSKWLLKCSGLLCSQHYCLCVVCVFVCIIYIKIDKYLLFAVAVSESPSLPVLCSAEPKSKDRTKGIKCYRYQVQKMTSCPYPADIQYWLNQGIWSMKQEWQYFIQSVQFIHWAFSILLQCCSQCTCLLWVQFHQFSE